MPGAGGARRRSLDGARLLLGVERDAHDDELPSGDIVVYDTATWTEVDRVPVDVYPEDIGTGPDGQWLAVAGLNSDEVQFLEGETLEGGAAR